MGQSAVRAAVTTFLTGLNLPGVGHVFKEWPYYFANATAFDQAHPYQLWQSALMVHLWRSSETRITLPAATGQKRRDHLVSVGVAYRYMIPNAAGSQPDQDQWVDGLDQIVDGLRSGIEAAPNLGNPNIIFQAGQDPRDLSLEVDLPVIDGSYVRILARLDVNVTEIITA